jgi:hypothetical protein
MCWRRGRGRALDRLGTARATTPTAAAPTCRCQANHTHTCTAWRPPTGAALRGLRRAGTKYCWSKGRQESLPVSRCQTPRQLATARADGEDAAPPRHSNHAESSQRRCHRPPSPSQAPPSPWQAPSSRPTCSSDATMAAPKNERLSVATRLSRLHFFRRLFQHFGRFGDPGVERRQHRRT